MQIIKLLGIPTTLILQYILFGINCSWETLASLFILLIGITIATLTDVDLSGLGCAIALVAVVVTSLAQVLSQQLQKRLALAQMVYMSYLFPFSSIILIMGIPFVENLAR